MFMGGGGGGGGAAYDDISCPRGTTYDNTGCLGGQLIATQVGPRGPPVEGTVCCMTNQP